MSDNLSVATMEASISASAERGAFSLFPKLPLELRRMIWWFSCCLNPPRLVHISGRLPNSWAVDLVARYQLPGQVQASQESRESALRYYDFAFGAQMKGMSIYFNFDTDALVFDRYWSISAFIHLCYDETTMKVIALSPSEKKVKAVAVLNDFRYGPHGVSITIEALGNPQYLQLIAPRGKLTKQGKLIKEKYQKNWLLRNPGGRDGYFGPTVNSSTIKQFQTMLNILHNPKLAPKHNEVSEPTRRSARLQGKAPSS